MTNPKQEVLAPHRILDIGIMRNLRSFLPTVMLALAACSTLPTAGPTTKQVYEQAEKPESLPFSLVEITPSVLAAAGGARDESLGGQFRGRPPIPRVGVGDTVSVTIWQSTLSGLPPEAPNSNGGPLLGNGTNSNSTGQITVPDQMISTDGSLAVPYAGRVRAAGRTTLQIEQAIEEALAGRLIEPKVLVTVPKSVTATATVSGETIGGVRTPLSPAGDRLLDVIAAAGGPKAPLYETEVRLTRGNVTGVISMDRLVLDPSENVQVWPGDEVTLIHAQKTFSVFGAAQNNSQLPFNAPRLSLAQAIARAGGLVDARADPSGVFLFRFEAPANAAAIGTATGRQAPSGVPTLYHLDLKQAGGYFLASHFALRDDDLVYIAGAPTNEVQKFFTLLSTLTAPVLSGVILAK